MNIKEIEDTYEVNVYPRRDLVLVRGKGSKLYDESGREYIDCAANIGVSNIGHGNEQVAKAIYEQYLRLANCYSMFYNDVRAKLAKKLAEITPGELNRVFFCNSGSEAVETAIKFVRSSTGKSEIICAMRGFHGKTMGSLSATWGQEYKKPFMPMLPGFVHVPYNNFEKLKTSVNDNTAAILLEVIQGEGGIRIGDKEFFRRVRELCDVRGILLIIDEVQTGFGRTGKMFACEYFVVPDILCLAKSIAGGVPMGAVVCNDKINVPIKSHTSTFGGNPLACAAALVTIEFIEKEDLVNRAAESGEYFLKKLNDINCTRIKEVRGLGLMIGIELKEKASPYVRVLMEKGIIVLLAGKYVIRLMPPLVISKEEIDYVVENLGEILRC
ncbi:MAG: aspartate aminotransferase family protein [Thermoplasmata archaeon]